MRQRIISVRGLSIEAYESDSKGPLVFLLHGNSSSAQSFNGLLGSRLGSDYRLVSLSLPGHGASGVSRSPDADYAVAGLAETAAHVVRHYGEPAFALIGHSLGGHVWTEALAALPEAKGLVLISAPPLSLASLGAAYKPDPVGGALFRGELSDGDVDAMAGALLGKARADAAVRATLERDLRRTDVAFRPALGKSLMEGRLGDAVKVAAESTVPLAMLWGAEDPFLQPAYSEGARLGRSLAGGKFAFGSAGHSVHLEEPGRVSDLLGTLLREAFHA